MARQVDSPIRSQGMVKRGDGITADSYNQLIDAVRRSTSGVAVPKQKKRIYKGSSGLPTYCRVLVDDATISLSGLPEVDGLTDLAEDDLALVALDTAADGVYEIKAGGPWFRVGRLSDQHGTDNAPVYATGALISVYDGNSAPKVFMHSIDNTLENI